MLPIPPFRGTRNNHWTNQSVDLVFFDLLDLGTSVCCQLGPVIFHSANVEVGVNVDFQELCKWTARSFAEQGWKTFAVIFPRKSFLFPWLDICCIQRLVCWFAYQIGAEHKSWSMYFHCHCWEICFTHLQGGPSWIYVLGSRIPLFPYNRGWSSTQ